MEDLKTTTTEVNEGKIDFDAADYPAAQVHFDNANASLDSAISNMYQASWYINQTGTGGMIQLDGTRDAVAAIYSALVIVQVDMIAIVAIADGGIAIGPEITALQGHFDNIVNTLATINTDLADITAQ